MFFYLFIHKVFVQLPFNNAVYFNVVGQIRYGSTDNRKLLNIKKGRRSFLRKSFQVYFRRIFILKFHKPHYFLFNFYYIFYLIFSEMWAYSYLHFLRKLCLRSLYIIFFQFHIPPTYFYIISYFYFHFYRSIQLFKNYILKFFSFSINFNF